MPVRDIIMAAGGSITPTEPPSFISNSTSTNVSGATISINTPAGAAVGDILLVFISSTSNRVTFTASGWTEVFNAGPPNLVSGNIRGVCLKTTISGTVPSSTVFTPSSGTPPPVAAIMMCFRPSGNTSSVVYSTTTQSGTSFIAPSVTPSQKSVLLVCYFTEASSSITFPSGFDATYSAINTSTVKNAGIARKVLNAGSGATGTFTATYGTSSVWNAASLLLF